MATKTVPLAELLAQSPFSPNIQSPIDASRLSGADLGVTLPSDIAKKYGNVPLTSFLGNVVAPTPVTRGLATPEEAAMLPPEVTQLPEAVTNLTQGLTTPLNIGLAAALPGVSGFAAKAIRMAFAEQGLSGAIKAAKARNIPEAMISGILGLSMAAPELAAGGRALAKSKLATEEAGFVDLGKLQDWPGYTRRALGEERITARVRKAEKRLAKPDVGAPANPRTPLVTKGGFTFVAGDNTPQDRLSLIADMMTPDEINKAAAWHGEIREQMGEHFGKENIDPTILAWAISQAAQSPEAGLREVLKAERLAQGLPEETGATPPYLKDFFDLTQIEKGIGQKLADFTDNMAGKRTRTMMNDDPRFGEPFTVDRHTARAGGHLDATFKGTLREIFGADQVDPLLLDVKEGREGEVPETKYEYQSRKGQELTKVANDTNFNGRQWKPEELQAAEWVAIRKMQGLAPQTAFEMFKNNYTTVPFELTWGDNSPFSQSMPSLSALPYKTNRAITQEVANKILEDLAPRFNVRVVKSEAVPGGWRENVNPVFRPIVLASDGAVRDFVSAAAYAANQTSGLAYRVLSSGKGNTSGFDVVSPAFSDRATVAKYARAMSEAEPKLGGFTVEEVNGTPAIRFLNADDRGVSNGLWSTKDFSGFDKIAEQVSTDLGVKTRTGWLSADIPAQSYNDWSVNPHGEQHLRRFLETGRSKDIEYLEGPFRAKVAQWTEEAFRKHAPDAWRNRPSAGAKPQTIVPEDIPGDEDLPNPFEEMAAGVEPVKLRYPIKVNKLGDEAAVDDFTRGWVMPDGSLIQVAEDHPESIAAASGGKISKKQASTIYPAVGAEQNMIRFAIHKSRAGMRSIAEMFTEPNDSQITALREIEKLQESSPLFDRFDFFFTDPATNKLLIEGSSVKNIRGTLQSLKPPSENPFE